MFSTIEEKKFDNGYKKLYDKTQPKEKIIMKKQKQQKNRNRLDTLRDNKTYMPTDECLIFALAKIEPEPEELANYIYYKYGNIEHLTRLAIKLQEKDLVRKLEAASDIIMQMKLKQIRQRSYTTTELQECLRCCSLNELCGMQRTLGLDPTIESEEKVYLDYCLEKSIRNCLLAQFTTGRNADEYESIACRILGQTKDSNRRELPTIKKHITDILRNSESISEAYEEELEQALNIVISEITHNPKSTIVKQYSYPWLCGIKRHLQEKNNIPAELKAMIDEQLTREIHDCILKVYKYAHSYKDIEGIITHAREEEQPVIKIFLESLQREEALKHLNGTLILIKNHLYIGHLTKYSLEELCEFERYLNEEGNFKPSEKAIIGSLLQSAIEYRIEIEPTIYEDGDAINELLERVNPLDREHIKAYIDNYRGKRFANHPVGQSGE